MLKRLALFALLAGYGCHSHVSSHVKYFGYSQVHSAQSVATIAPWSNIAVVSELSPDEFSAANAGKLKLVPYLGSVFFIGSHLRADYQAAFAVARNAWKLDSNLSAVLAFYLANEPTLRGISAGDLATAADFLKSQFPTVPIALVEAYVALSRLVVPDAVDWIGFDQYGILDVNANADYVANYGALLSKRTRPTQRTIIVMDAFWNPAHPFAPSELGTVAQNYLRFAQAHSEVIGIAAFSWEHAGDFQPGWPSTVDLPSLVVTHRQIGKTITGK